jgi:uncharacterized protein (DUF608 family)
LGNTNNNDGAEPGAWTCLPVGGVGTGTIGFGSDARFRQITINNNRGPGEQLPLSPHSGLALRLATQAGTVYLHRLHTQPPGEHAPEPEPEPIPQDALKARLEYPLAHYELSRDHAPAVVQWSHFAPLVPYDYDGATLPVLVTRVTLENPGDAPLEASVVFCLENLVGHTGAGGPAAPAPGRLMLVEEERRYVKRFEQREGPSPSEIQANPRRAGEAPPPPREEVLPPNNTVCFGAAGTPETPAHGEHLLIVRAADAVEVTANAFDPEVMEEANRFWGEFSAVGTLPKEVIAGSTWRVGGVCGHMSVPPHTSRALEFLLVWYCPRFDSQGEDIGVAYAGARGSALQVAKHALQHLTYFYESVTNWQKRFSEASLPAWMSEMLLNSACVLSSNTLCTYNEGFGVAESPATGRTACLDGSRLFSSLGAMLYFPRYNETELALLAHAEQPQSTGRLPRDLGAWALRAAELNHPTPLRVRLAAGFLVMAYRDFVLTGKLVRLQNVFSVMRAVMAATAALDRDGDGIPDCGEEEAHTAEGVGGRGVSCIDAGLWVVALRAYALLCEKLRDTAGAQRFNLLANRAAQAFDRLYWDDALGYYRLYRAGCGPNAEACHTGQFTGPWYAAFLGLEGLFHTEHIARALEHTGEINRHGRFIVAARRPGGDPCANPAGDPVACEGGLAWLGLTLCPYASMLVYQGHVVKGIEAAEHLCEAQRRINGAPFNYYDRWDPGMQAPPPGALPRHAAAMGIWHLHYAVQGFLFNAPDQRMRIMPNLPEGVRSLSAPLMTPLCLGWLNYKIDDEQGYRQRVRIRLDSPIQMRSFELRIPADIPSVRVSLRQITSGWVPIDHGLRSDGNAQRLYVALRSPMLVASDILIEVVRAQAPAPPPQA